MNSKSIARIVLLAFVAAALVFLGIRESQDEKQGDVVPAASNSGIEPAHQVIAYYFHGERRCPSCLQIEAYAKGAIETGFSAELQNGRLSWRVVNFETDGNEHFVKDYQLVSQSLVIVDRHDGTQTRWQSIEQVWELLGNKQAFTQYVQDSISVYLKES